MVGLYFLFACGQLIKITKIYHSYIIFLNLAETKLFTVLTGLALPSPVHATLTAAELGDGQIIVIGDVHGCPVELKALLDK